VFRYFRKHIEKKRTVKVALASPEFSTRLYYVLFEWQTYAAQPGDILAIWKGGIAIHGAVLGGTLAAWIFARLNRLFFGS